MRAHRSWAKATEVQSKEGREFREVITSKLETVRVKKHSFSYLTSHAAGRRLAAWYCQGNELQQRGLSPAVLDVAPGKGR